MGGSASYREILTAPLIRRNPITLQILGICSALAVTTTLATAVTMSLSLTVVLVIAAGIISTIRRHLPGSIRLIIQIVVIASLVIVIDQTLKAFFPQISRALSVYVGLITTNCLVMGRAEVYARHHPPLAAMIDALGNSLGYSAVLIVIGASRELLGRGSLLGRPMFPLAEAGGWFTPLSLMLLAPSAFILLGLLVWAVRSVWPEQIEAPENEGSLPAEQTG